MNARRVKTDTPNPLLTSGLYDFLKFVALVALPAIGTFYFALASIWGFPAAEEVLGTIVATETFLGLLLKLDKSKYDTKVLNETPYDGELVVNTHDPMKDTYMFELEDSPVHLSKKDVLTFRVRHDATE